MTKITPETAPVGARILVQYLGGLLFEVTVLEWLTDGRAVKLLVDESGRKIWDDRLPIHGWLVERLPSTENLSDSRNY